MQPKANLKSYSLTKRTYHSAEMSTNTRIIHRPGRKAQTDLNWGISKSTESLKFSFNAALNSQGRHSASFSISSHLTTTPEGSALRWRDSIRADKGTIVASAFVDKNGDQIRNPGEEMLPNPEIQTRGQRQKRCAEKGICAPASSSRMLRPVCMVAPRAALRILPHTETGGDGRTGRLKVVTPALGNPWAPRKDLDGNALSGIGGRLCPCTPHPKAAFRFP